MAVHEGDAYRAQGKSISLGSLTEGNTTDEVQTIGCNRIGFFVAVSSLGTSVTVAIQASPDGSNWYFQSRTVIDVDSSRLVVFENCNLVKRARLKWEGSVGGAPTMTVEARLS